MAVYYGVLKGKVVRTGRTENVKGSKNHFHVIVDCGERKLWRCPVNIRSADGSEVWFKVEQPLADFPVLKELAALPVGLKELPERKSGLALDYVREPMFDRGLMTHLPSNGNGASDDIQDFLAVHTERAKRDPGAHVYVFGSWWRGRAFDADRFFETDQGVHDVHMNQGNAGRFQSDDGIFQDGGLLFWYPTQGWVGFFLAFNTQVWVTDAKGHRLPGYPEGPLAMLENHPLPVRPSGVPVVPAPVSRPEAAPLCIVAALVNPAGADQGKETVTLFNASLDDVSLDGWRLVDRRGGEERLPSQVLPGNTAVTLKMSGSGAQLSNHGDTLRLISPQGVQVETVSYSNKQAEAEGRIIRF